MTEICRTELCFSVLWLQGQASNLVADHSIPTWFFWTPPWRPGALESEPGGTQHGGSNIATLCRPPALHPTRKTSWPKFSNTEKEGNNYCVAMVATTLYFKT